MSVVHPPGFPIQLTQDALVTTPGPTMPWCSLVEIGKPNRAPFGSGRESSHFARVIASSHNSSVRQFVLCGCQHFARRSESVVIQLTAICATAARRRNALVTSSTEMVLSLNTASSWVTVYDSVISISRSVRISAGRPREFSGKSSGMPSIFGSTLRSEASRLALSPATLSCQVVMFVAVPGSGSRDEVMTGTSMRDRRDYNVRCILDIHA